MAKRGEFAFIENIERIFGDLSVEGIEGIGDDCAVIPAGGGESLVVTADMLTEGVHFLRVVSDPYLLGRKSLAVNLSDVASMGARPFATLLSLALPGECRGAWAEEFMRGYRELSGEYGVALIGGDTTSSCSGVTVNVTAIGRVGNARIKRRSAARPGDAVAVTDMLGASAAGLADILAGRTDTPAVREHMNPRPHVEEGMWLGARSEVHAMTDLSDGLASDLLHIVERSGMGAEVEITSVPTLYSEESAVAGGEDYKLLLTVAPEAFETLAADFGRRFGRPLYRVGRMTEGGDSVVWLRDGARFEPDWHGFDHFER